VTVFKLAAAGAALWPVLFLLASQRDPPAQPAPVAGAVEQRWPDDPPAGPKADRLPLYAAAAAIPQATEVPVQVAAARIDVPATASVRRHTEADNICTRHHMRKVTTRGGRSWRCRA
jgi:hypothetical protein